MNGYSDTEQAGEIFASVNIFTRLNGKDPNFEVPMQDRIDNAVLGDTEFIKQVLRPFKRHSRVLGAVGKPRSDRVEDVLDNSLIEFAKVFLGVGMEKNLKFLYFVFRELFHLVISSREIASSRLKVFSRCSATSRSAKSSTKSRAVSTNSEMSCDIDTPRSLQRSSRISWISRLKVTVSLGSVVGMPKCSTSAARCQGLKWAAGR